MLRFSKIFFYFTIVVLLLWQLPWCYNFFTATPHKSLFTLYSSVLQDFVQTGNPDGTGVIRRDLNGNIYSQRQVDSLLPTFYYRQLVSDERFPDTLDGIAVTPRFVQTENFTFRSTPGDINKPHIELYPLMESMSGRVELIMPTDVFRITSQGIEFVDMATNSINTQKSALFTEAMTKKDFQFPATLIAGNPTTRKEYDEGYLILDARSHLFHLKMVKDRPYVRFIELPDSFQPKQLFVTEFRNRKSLAFLTDVNNHFYVLESKTYELMKVEIPSYNPETDAITVLGNFLDWTIRVTTSETDSYYAIRSDSYSLIKSYQAPVPEETMAEKIGKYIFPLKITFTSPADKFVKPRI